MKIDTSKTIWNLSPLFKSDDDPEIETRRSEVNNESYKFINKWFKRNDYLEILRKVFCEGEGVYGGLSTEYLDATERYFKVYPQDRRLDYIAYYEGSPVGTTSFLFNDNYAVIIAAATLPEFQKKGIAKSMISKGIEKMSGKTIFLVTETKTVNEDIYKRMGFNTKLIEPVYIKEKI